MNFKNDERFDNLVNDLLLGLDLIGKQFNYILCTPGLNILFWLIMLEILIALVLTDLSNHGSINYF